MKIYISADIEGIAGVVSRDQLMPESFEYERARQWMTAEVNAAIEAAFVAGVSKVVVSDSHGNGQNLLIEKLPENVLLVRSWPRPLEMMQGIEEGVFVGAILLGYHASASYKTGGLAHTIHGGAFSEIRINDQVVGEAAISAATAGHFGVPIIMISGDDAFVKETTGFLPDVETSICKSSYSLSSAKTITPAQSCTQISERVTASLARLNDFSPFTFKGPLSLEIDFRHRAPAEVLDYLSVFERTSTYSVKYSAENMIDVSRTLAFLTGYKPVP